MLFGTHGFTIACFVCSSAFSFFWLYRWRAVKRSNPQLLLAAWRFLAAFLLLSFASGSFGIAAWIAKMTNVSHNSILSSPQTNLTCQHQLELQTKSNQSQSAYRICYSIEFACLYMSILLSLDRISELANGTKKLSKQSRKNSLESGGSGGGGRGRGASSGRADEQSMPIRLTESAARLPTGKRLQMLQPLFRAGIAFVAVCSASSIVAVITAASIQAEISKGYEQASAACRSDGSFTDLSVQISTYTYNYNLAPLMRAIFAGHVSEFTAAIVIIVLYATFCALGVSIILKARRKIQASMVKLEEVQGTISSHLEAKALTAGAGRVLMCMMMKSAALMFCCSVDCPQ